MGLKSFFKKLFGGSENVVENSSVVESTPTIEPVKAEVIQKVEAVNVEVDVKKATEVLENRLKEINTEKKAATEKKVTAKEIKAKVKTEKPVVEKTKPAKKAKPQAKTVTPKVEGKSNKPKPSTKKENK